MKTVGLTAPRVRIPHSPNFFLVKKEKILDQERCPSGRRGLTANQLYRLGTGGSNPPFSGLVKKNMNFEKYKKHTTKLKAFFLEIYTDYIKTFDPLLLSYFPFIGWFIPMTMKKDDEFYMYHAKQGFVLAVFFTGVCTFLFFFLYFVSVRADILKFIIVMVIYFLYIVYIVFAVMGTRMILRGEKGEFPHIGKYVAQYTSKLNI